MAFKETIMKSAARFSHPTSKGTPTITVEAVAEGLLEQAAKGRDGVVQLTAGTHFKSDTPSAQPPALIAQIGLTNAVRKFGTAVTVSRNDDVLSVRLRGLVDSEAARAKFGDELVDAALSNGVREVELDPRGRKTAESVIPG